MNLRESGDEYYGGHEYQKEYSAGSSAGNPGWTAPSRSGGT